MFLGLTGAVLRDYEDRHLFGDFIIGNFLENFQKTKKYFWMENLTTNKKNYKSSTFCNPADAQKPPKANFTKLNDAINSLPHHSPPTHIVADKNSKFEQFCENSENC